MIVWLFPVAALMLRARLVAEPSMQVAREFVRFLKTYASEHHDIAFAAGAVALTVFGHWVFKGRKGLNPMWFVLSAVTTLLLLTSCRPENLRVSVIKANQVLGQELCADVIAAADEFAVHRGGWKSRMRHAHYATEDVKSKRGGRSKSSERSTASACVRPRA